MSAPTQCLRCGGANLISAQLEHGLSFCLDCDTHHGVRRVGLRAVICEDCGHVEFWAKDPTRVLRPDRADHNRIVQEEDF